MNKILFYLSFGLKKIWVRCCLYCFFAVVAIIVGPYLARYIPSQLSEIVTSSALVNILTILASSMLAVTTFSLSIMVQAFNTAATTATPRASELLIQNSTAQNVLGAFIGAFLFSIIGIVGMSAKLYSNEVATVLFVFTIIVIIIVIVMLLRWISHLSEFGRVSVTIEMVENALHRSIQARASKPNLKALPLPPELEETLRGMHPIGCSKIGHVQYIDIDALNTLAKTHDIEIYVVVNTGNFLDSVKPVAFASKNISEDAEKAIAEAYVVDRERTFEQDPRYGCIVLSEIAIRALSPGINDPGTAISILGCYVRSIRQWVDITEANKDPDIVNDRVYVSSITAANLLNDMYSVLIPDAAKHLGVSAGLKESLKSMESFGNSDLAEAASIWIDELEKQCQYSLPSGEQSQQLKEV